MKRFLMFLKLKKMVHGSRYYSRPRLEPATFRLLVPVVPPTHRQIKFEFFCICGPYVYNHCILHCDGCRLLYRAAVFFAWFLETGCTSVYNWWCLETPVLNSSLNSATLLALRHRTPVKSTTSSDTGN